MSVTKSSPAPTDLQMRVENRKRDLISEIVEHKKNSSRANAAEEIDKIKARLSELTHLMKETVLDGWANVSSSAKVKLDAWIAK
jgi:hypothetical protein